MRVRIRTEYDGWHWVETSRWPYWTWKKKKPFFPDERKNAERYARLVLRPEVEEISLEDKP